MKKRLVALVCIGIGLGIGLGLGTGIAGALVAGQRSTSVTLCVSKSTGAVRVATTCSRKERPLTIAKQGPRGARGAAGARGATGPVGPATGKAGGALTGTYPNPGLAAPEGVQPVQPAHDFDACTDPVVVGTFCGGTADFQPSFWFDYGDNYQEAGYWRDQDGLVHLRGAVAEKATNHAYAKIFILPPDYRPLVAETFVVRDDSQSNAPVGAVIVFPSGLVQSNNPFPPFLSLSGITFRTDE